MLEITGLHAGYGRAEVLHGISLVVQPFEVVALVGSNGAGKSTTLNTVAGTVRISAGSVLFDGVDLARIGVDRRAHLGIGQVPEGRRLFRTLPVEDNLILGAFHLRRKRAVVSETLAEVYDRFPLLRERRRAHAGTLSGGEAQMLAIGRALMGCPRLLILDEPSLGLAPRIVAHVFTVLQDLARTGVGVLLAEQNALFALDYADRGLVLERGRVSLEAVAKELREHPEFVSTYLGGVEG